MTDKAIKEPRTRTPEEKVLIGIIQQAMEDSFDLSSSTNLSMGEIQQARNWFYTAACRDICDHLGTTHDHIKKLYNICLLYTSPSPRDNRVSRMPSSA